jgi:cytochrome c biogenesis protein CcmG, thiol:disulfide interchange protein DsbE
MILSFFGKRSLWALAISGPLLVVLAFGFGRDPNAINSPLLGKAAPTFILQTLDQHPLSLAALRGKPVVLNFWASWCTGCLSEHPYLLDAWRAYHAKGLAIVGVVYDDKQSDARSFIQQYGGGWPDVLDPGQRTAINYGVYGVPETYFIDRGGVIRAKSTGMVTPELLHQWIGRLLKSG